MMVHPSNMKSILGMENCVDTGKGPAFWYRGLGKASSSESSLNRVIFGRPDSTLIVGCIGRGKVEVEDTRGVRSSVEQGGSESLRPYALYVQA